MSRKRSRTAGERRKLVVHDVERLLHGALEVERQLAAEPVKMPEDLHDPHRVRAQRARVAIGQVQAAVEEDETVRERLLALPPLGGAAARRASPGSAR